MASIFFSFLILPTQQTAIPVIYSSYICCYLFVSYVVKHVKGLPSSQLNVTTCILFMSRNPTIWNPNQLETSFILTSSQEEIHQKTITFGLLVFAVQFFLYKKSLHFFANATTTTSACSSRQPDCFDLRSLNYNHHSLLQALPTTHFFYKSADHHHACHDDDGAWEFFMRSSHWLRKNIF